MNRTELLLNDLEKHDKIVEIGPSHAPLAPKSRGWNSFSVDHATRDELIAKYNGMGVDTSLVEVVDFVWRGGSITEAIPQQHHATFKAFIASHVIEHSPDIIRFLLSAQHLLTEDGKIVLALPDKRKSFDFYRPLSTTSDALVAFYEQRSKHTAKTHFDNAAFACNRNGDAGWLETDTRPLAAASDLAGARQHWNMADKPDYVDAHAWIFTPASFELMVIEISELGHLDLRLERREENPTTEFYAWLRRGRLPSEQVQARRIELLNEIIVELAEQARQIEGSKLWEAYQPHDGSSLL
jgi:hypothetical protein